MSYVWVLGFLVEGYHEKSMTIVDNIASIEECERVRKVFNDSFPNIQQSRCIQVGKKP